MSPEDAARLAELVAERIEAMHAGRPWPRRSQPLKYVYIACYGALDQRPGERAE
jgi:hypothetical protein